MLFLLLSPHNINLRLNLQSDILGTIILPHCVKENVILGTINHHNGKTPRDKTITN